MKRFPFGESAGDGDLISGGCSKSPYTTILDPQCLAPTAVELANDLDMARKQALHHLNWPLLKCLGHHSV
eukprot:2254493-Amphidinium_carterae.1